HSQGFCFPLLSPPLGVALCYICVALHAQGVISILHLPCWLTANGGSYIGLFYDTAIYLDMNE
ncbi:MAG: hypothetical protein RR653_13510, partial [Clostridia bacterium]